MSQKMSNRVPQLSPALESIGNISNITYKSVKTPDSLKAQRFDQAYSYDVFRFINKLKTNKIWGSSDVAKDTCVLLRDVIFKGKFSSVEELITEIKAIGRELTRAKPLELVIGNIVRRVLYIIRRECRVNQNKNDTDGDSNGNGGNIDDDSDNESKIDKDNDEDAFVPSILDMFHKKKEINYKLQVSMQKYKSNFISEINYLLDEINDVYSGIQEYSVEHIHSNEIILTYGYSTTVLKFLSKAAKYRSFEVFVCESAPEYKGHEMSLDLVKNGIKSVTLISDSSIFALMSRINKVIIGTHSCLANGGLLNYAGTNGLCIAAKYYKVPVLVVAGLYKLSPLYSFNQDTFNSHGSSNNIISYQKYSKLINNNNNISINNPNFDYVSPKLIDLFITNQGGHNPSYIYRLLAEYYDAFDYDLN